MFCAIATTIERCKTEGVVDVFQVVKALRVQKPGAVHTVVSASLHLAIYTYTQYFLSTCRNSMRLFLRQFLCFWTHLILIQILVNRFSPVIQRSFNLALPIRDGTKTVTVVSFTHDTHTHVLL